MFRNAVLSISSIILFAGATVFGQSAAVMSKATRMTGDSFPVAAHTIRGANVRAASRPAPAILAAIDRGLSDLFMVARKNGYSNRLNYTDYTIYIARADRNRDSQGQYSPDIAIGAAQYRGSVYDQGGYIFAAGLVLSTEASAFVIAEHTRDLGRISNVVRYEGEHIVLYHNDRRRFSATMDHSQGGGHPILH